jgi:hypothetical protein
MLKIKLKIMKKKMKKICLDLVDFGRIIMKNNLLKKVFYFIKMMKSGKKNKKLDLILLKKEWTLSEMILFYKKISPNSKPI